MASKSLERTKNEPKTLNDVSFDIQYNEVTDPFVKIERRAKSITVTLLKLLFYGAALVVAAYLLIKLILILGNENFRYYNSQEIIFYISISLVVFLLIVAAYFIPYFYSRFFAKPEFETIEIPVDTRTEIQPIELVGVKNEFALSLLWVEIQNELKRSIFKTSKNESFTQSTLDLPINTDKLELNNALREKINRILIKIEESIENREYDTQKVLTLVKEGNKTLTELKNFKYSRKNSL